MIDFMSKLPCKNEISPASATLHPTLCVTSSSKKEVTYVKVKIKRLVIKELP
jgi:hypothetical protein